MNAYLTLCLQPMHKIILSVQLEVMLRMGKKEGFDDELMGEVCWRQRWRCVSALWDIINWQIFLKVNSSKQQQRKGIKEEFISRPDKIIWKIIASEPLKCAKIELQRSQNLLSREFWRRVNRRPNPRRWRRGVWRQMPANRGAISGQIAPFLPEPCASQNGSISKYNFSRYRWLELLSGWATRGGKRMTGRRWSAHTHALTHSCACLSFLTNSTWNKCRSIIRMQEEISEMCCVSGAVKGEKQQINNTYAVDRTYVQYNDLKSSRHISVMWLPCFCPIWNKCKVWQNSQEAANTR